MGQSVLVTGTVDGRWLVVLLRAAISSSRQRHR
jgi:hypothetical protein